MMLEPVHPYICPSHRVKFAVNPWEIEGCRRLRRDVFCAEQQLFTADDTDAIDDVATPIAAISNSCGWEDGVVGTVRIHPGKEPSEWWGSRLAVARPYRKQAGLGTSMIRLAVSSAHAMGATSFFAHVQSRNALLFQRLHWHTLEEVELHGQPHHFMQADLDFYPPIHDGAVGFENRTDGRAEAQSA